MPTVLARDDDGRVINWDLASVGEAAPVAEGSPTVEHTHEEYEPAGSVATHAATPHGGEAGPHDHSGVYEPVHTGHTHDHDANYSATGHAHTEYATDADLTTHAGTAHGLASHAIDGAYHSGTGILPTSGEKNALAGTNGTPGSLNRYVTDSDARLTDARSPTAHTHDTYATDADLAAHAATEHGGGSIPAGVIVMWGGNVNQIPSGWNLCDGTNGTPDLTDRFIKGGIPGSTGGAATHTHAAHTAPLNHTHPVVVTDPGHTHVQGVNSATTGGSSGYTPDTSTNNRVNSGYSTSSGTTGITASTSDPAGGVASLTHDAPNHEPPYYTLAFIQKA